MIADEEDWYTEYGVMSWRQVVGGLDNRRAYQQIRLEALGSDCYWQLCGSAALDEVDAAAVYVNITRFTDGGKFGLKPRSDFDAEDSRPRPHGVRRPSVNI